MLICPRGSNALVNGKSLALQLSVWKANEPVIYQTDVIFGQAYMGKSHHKESGNCIEMAQVHRSFTLESHVTSHHNSPVWSLTDGAEQRPYSGHLYTICADNKLKEPL